MSNTSACTVASPKKPFEARCMRLGAHAKREGQSIPDDGLFVGVIERHEELRVLSNATDKVPDKDVEAVGG